MGLSEGLRAGMALGMLPEELEAKKAQRDLSVAEVKRLEAAMKLSELEYNQKQGLQAELAKLGQQSQFSPEQLTTIEQLKAGQQPITQTSFGEEAATHQPVINNRYGPQTPAGVNVHAGLGASTADTLTVDPYAMVQAERSPQPEGTVQAVVEEPYRVEHDKQWFFNRVADEIGQRQKIAPEVVRLFKSAVLTQETKDYDATAVSPKGAKGLAQLMPGTAKELGVTDPDDPIQSISGGLRYLQQQYDRFGKDPAKALAAYNAGPGNVEKHGGVPPFKETQNYVKRGIAAYNAAGQPVDTSQMVADASGRATPTPAQPPVEQWAGIQQQWQSGAAQPPTQMGPPEPVQQAPQAQQTMQIQHPDLDKLRQMGMVYAQHGKPEQGFALIKYAEEQTNLRQVGNLIQQFASGAHTEQDRAYLQTSLAALLARAGQVTESYKALESALPLTTADLLRKASGQTVDKYLAMGGLGNAQQAAQQAVQEREQEKAAQFTDVIKGEDGNLYAIDKRTNAWKVIAGPGDTPAASVPAQGAPQPASQPTAQPVAQDRPQGTGQPTAQPKRTPLEQEIAAGPQGKSPFKKDLTEAQAKAGQFGDSMWESHNILVDLENGGTAADNPLATQIDQAGRAVRDNSGLALSGAAALAGAKAGAVGGPLGMAGGAVLAVIGANGLPILTDTAANALRTPEQRRLVQAQLTFLQSFLRKTSGAAISASEYADGARRFFATARDDKALIAQKRNDRAREIAAIQQEAGRQLRAPTLQLPPQTPEEHGVKTLPGGEKVRVPTNVKRTGWNTLED